MELPSGGTFVGQVACDKGWTIYSGNPNKPAPKRACTPNPDPKKPDQSGALHSSDPWSTPIDQLTDVKGTALGIAYESDITKLKPEDFVIISTNQTSPWLRDTEYKIPAGLPACPEGGCHCMWGWIHGIKGGKSNEMYMTGYRCQITSFDPNGKPLPKPRIANKCPVDNANCTVGAKQAHFWSQKEGNNNFQDNLDPPFYNTDYGFTDGAQTDLWTVADSETPQSEGSSEAAGGAASGGIAADSGSTGGSAGQVPPAPGASVPGSVSAPVDPSAAPLYPDPQAPPPVSAPVDPNAPVDPSAAPLYPDPQAPPPGPEVPLGANGPKKCTQKRRSRQV
jgi:hypothetical protein